ncbi:MAG: GTP-binding protein [bacterium]|nr:GTP-binding protein [bacterium]
MIPILLITGFLGTGKTTFINWLLKENPHKKISIILNEFGDTKLESHFIDQPAEGVFELANGCMCCVAKSDIPRVIRYILQRAPQTEYILIEASGLSDPDPVRDALQSPPISLSCHLDSTICMVDTVTFEVDRLQHPLITSQIADSDLVVLNKLEEAGAEKTAAVLSILQRNMPDSRIIPFNTQLSAEVFLTAIPSATTSTKAMTEAHSHLAYSSYIFSASQPLDYHQLLLFLQQLPKEIIRVKGIVNCKFGTDEVMVKVQKVGSRVSLDEYKGVFDENNHGTLLFIGTALSEELLSTKLQKMSVGS